MHTLVRANGDRPLDAGQCLIVTGGQRLFDHGDASLRAGREMALQIVLGPGLVGVHDQFRHRSRLADCRDPGFVALATEFDLEQRAMGGLCRGHGHGFGRAQRNRVGGGQRTRRGQFQHIPDPLICHFGFDIPKRAVERVACRAWRHPGLKRLTIQPLFERVPKIEHRSQCSLSRFAIAGIGNTLAASGQTFAADLGDNYDGFGLCAPADSEAASNGPALDFGGEI